MKWFARHVRDNVVGYLALIIALSGTSYAVAALPRGSVGTAQLRNGAVTTAKLHGHAVTAAKVAPGLLSRTRSTETQVDFADAQPADPVASPDRIAMYHPLTWSMPTAGHATVVLAVDSLVQACSSGIATAGLYVDDKPVPHTFVNLSSLSFFDGHPNGGEHFGGTVSLPAGSHHANIGIDCASGDLSGGTYGNATWTLTLSQ
ncbi:MAG TPA: hypothetical protein VJ872_09305 [Nocardioides sp.]|nr:hypothetical protein [Nocardioides sp.]